MTGLKIKNLNKTLYGVEIIKDVTASFLPGNITALVGPNGAGKTTIFNLICGYLVPDGGAVFYNHENITGLEPYKVARKGIGRLFQDVRIFDNMTLQENIITAWLPHSFESPLFPFVHPLRLKKVYKDAIEQANFWLEFVGLYEKKNHLASALSFGQQKLLAIARLLAKESKVLLLDEPASGLSPVATKKVLGILEKIIAKDKHKIIVIVEHNMKLVTEMADWVYFMNEGQVAFFGRTDHVLGSRTVRELYLGF